MRGRLSWRDLIGEPPLCEGGRLASIIFCCDPRKVVCPVLEEALKMIGISKEDFVKVMEECKIPTLEKDGTCFGNLAFCPSPEKPSRDRDETLLKLGWSLSKYLRYKFEILRKLVSPEKLDYVFTTRVLRQFAVTALDLETRKVYRMLTLGNVRGGIMLITEVFDESELRGNVRDALGRTEYVAVRIPKDMVAELDDLVSKGIIESRSDGIRRALALYLNALKTGVKHHVRVKQ